MKKFIMLFISILTMFTLCGCISESDYSDSGGKVKIVDDNKRTVVLEKVPQRIVVLSPSFLEILEKFDAKIVGRATTKIGKIPTSTQKIDEVGYVFNINIEKVIGLKPDLVIAYKGMHERYLQILESNHIPVIVLNLKSYDDVKHSLVVLGKVMGQKTKGEKLADELDADIQRIAKHLPNKPHSVAILHATSMGITLEKETSIAGCCAKLLRLKNIMDSTNTPPVPGPMGSQTDMAPYSLEYLVEKDPQIIFITSMGAEEEIKGKMQNELMSNRAWRNLTAVKCNNVFYLPDELFLLNPGLRYTQAVQLMAAKLQSATFND